MMSSLINGFSLEYPYVLVFILLFIIASYLFKTQVQSYYIPYIVDFLPSQEKKMYIEKSLKWICIVSAIIAISSPILITKVQDLDKHSIDIVLNIDTSGSMSLNGFNELDYTQDRLEVVKSVVVDFIHQREKDRIALVIFGDTSLVASPLSYDNLAPLNIVKQINIGVVGKSTALIDSIVTATELLKNSFSSSKVIILLTDGDDTASKIPLEIALKIAKKHNIRIYTIAIGESNNNMLKLISKNSNARNFMATNKKDLTKVYESITKLEEQTHYLLKEEKREYLYIYFLYISTLSALLLGYLIRNGEEF